MQISKKNITPQLDEKIHSILFQVLSDIKSPKSIEEFLTGLLTESEMVALSKRLAIAYYLKSGKSYEYIRDNLKVSSATIAAVQDKLSKDQGLNAGVKQVEADEWATDWAKKITNIFK